MAQDCSEKFYDLEFALRVLGFAMEELESDLKKVPLDEEMLRF